MSKHYIHQSGELIEVDREEPKHYGRLFDKEWDAWIIHLKNCPRYPWRGEPLKEGERLAIESADITWTCQCPTINIRKRKDGDSDICSFCDTAFVQVAFPVSAAAKGDCNCGQYVGHYQPDCPVHPPPAEGKQGDASISPDSIQGSCFHVNLVYKTSGIYMCHDCGKEISLHPPAQHTGSGYPPEKWSDYDHEAYEVANEIAAKPSELSYDHRKWQAAYDAVRTYKFQAGLKFIEQPDK